MSNDWQTAIVSNTPVNVEAKPAKRRIKRVADRWVNPISGYGTGTDPAAITYFANAPLLARQQLEAIYEHDWLGRRIIEALPNAATQKGITLETETDEQELKDGALRVIKRLKKWETIRKIKHLAYEARLYGSAAKVNYLDDKLPTAAPVNYSRVTDLLQSRILNRYFCRPNIFYNDPYDLERYDTPWTYQVFEMSLGRMNLMYDLHQSRLTWMDGVYLPTHLKIKNWGASNSVLQPVREVLRGYGTSIQSLTATIQDFVTKVLQLEDLDDLLEENEEQLEYRIMQADAKTNIHNISVVGKGETLTKFGTPITHLPAAIMLQMDTVAASANTPKSRLFGNLTGTLGSSSGKYDQSNWSDQVEDYQADVLTPAVEAAHEKRPI